MVVEVKNPRANAKDIREAGLIPDSERFPEKGNGNQLQYSCLDFLSLFFLSDFFYGNQSTQVFNLFLSNLENYILLVICPFHKEFIIH